VADELTWLESLLADGRPYLVGESLSRADITAASLFTRLSGAPEHPLAAVMFLPPKIQQDQEAWHDRPVMAWIRGIYSTYR
jgi:glutathione S-transferase